MLRFALTCILLALAPAVARGERVTYVLTGVLTYVEDGGDGKLDLTGSFHVGQAFLLQCEVDREATSFPEGAYQVTYSNPVTDVNVLIGTFSASGAALSIASVQDDLPPSTYDQLALQANPLDAPFGNGSLQSFVFLLRDEDASVFDTKELPHLLPPAGDFELTEVVLTFVDPVAGNGMLFGTVSELATPAAPRTWGRLKALYLQ